jgi:hypothetical protein
LGKKKKRGERTERKNGRQLVGAGDIYDGQLFLHVVENRPRRCPIFFPAFERPLLSITEDLLVNKSL